MKKLLLVSIMTMALALGTGPAMAAQFEIDLWGGTSNSGAKGNGMDTTLDIQEGETVMATVWVTGIAGGQLVGYIDTEFSWDTT